MLGGRRIANYLRVLTLEAQTLARACGKSHVHNLEPEDLVALTVEAAAMAQRAARRHGLDPGHERRSVTVVLYDSAVSGNCYKVRLLFALLGVEYERRPLSVVDKSDREEVLGELNPGLRVPTRRPRRRARRWASRARFSGTSPTGRSTCPPIPTTARRCCSGCSSSSTATSRTSPSPATGSCTTWRPSQEALAEKQRGGYAALDGLERGLADGRDFLAGGFSIADIALYAYTHVADQGGFDLVRLPGDPGVDRSRGRAAGLRPDRRLTHSRKAA